MKRGQKVYWIKGWPNNGYGYFLLKIFQWYFVRDRPTGDIVVCTMCETVEKMIKDKQSLIDDTDKHGGPSDAVRGMYYENKYSIISLKKFLAE